MRSLAFSFAFLLLLTGCPRTGGGGDAGLPDAGSADAGAPPDTSIVDAPESPSAQATVRFALESDVAGAGFECSLDQAPFEACTASPTYEGLTDGRHTFAARAVDALGRVDSTPATWEWRTDLTPPDTRIDAAPDAPVAADVTPVFDFSATEPARFECRMDTAPWAACEAPWAAPAQAPGAHVFEVRAVDEAGNVDPTPASADLVVLPGAPDTVIVTGPEGLTTSRDATFSFEASQTGCTFECRIDAAAFATCTSPKAFVGLADGAHVFEVRASNADGEVDPTPARRAFSVDTTPPDTRIVSGPTGATFSRDATFRFEADEAGCTFECRFDGAPFASCTSPASSTGLTVGDHRFEVRATDPAGFTDATPAARDWSVLDGGNVVTVRIVAANVTSGNYQAYEDPGIRILQALAPDVALVQEMNYASNTDADIRSFVDQAFGTNFEYFREADAQIPNGIVSRYPILESGEWTDPEVSNRDFAWARIDVPGPVDLWAVSLHLLTDGSRRPAEASELVNDILHAFPNIPSSDYLVIGGDFNTKSRTETCVNTLGQVVDVSGPYPADQDGVDGTSAARDHPYDWVLADADLRPLQVPVVVGSSTFDAGLVFDTRVFVPLSDVPPAELGDSAASNMQHMAVAKDFALPQ